MAAGPGALNPLALQILGNLAADEVAVAGVLNLDLRSGDGRLRVEEGDALLVSGARRAPLDAGRHDAFPSASKLASASSAATACRV